MAENQNEQRGTAGNGNGGKLAIWILVILVLAEGAYIYKTHGNFSSSSYPAPNQGKHIYNGANDPPVVIHDGSLNFGTNEEQWLIPNNGSSTVTAANFTNATIPPDWTEVDVCNAYTSGIAIPCAHGISIKPNPTQANPTFFLVTLTDKDYPSGIALKYNSHRFTDHELVDANGSDAYWPNVLVVTGVKEPTTTYSCSTQNAPSACEVDFGTLY